MRVFGLFDVFDLFVICAEAGLNVFKNFVNFEAESAFDVFFEFFLVHLHLDWDFECDFVKNEVGEFFRDVGHVFVDEKVHVLLKFVSSSIRRSVLSLV